MHDSLCIVRCVVSVGCYLLFLAVMYSMWLVVRCVLVVMCWVLRDVRCLLRVVVWCVLFVDVCCWLPFRW